MTTGRPAIDESRYHAQIEEWLRDGQPMEAITATHLQKAVGGRYKRACTILENYRAGYEQRKTPEIRELSDTEMQEALMIINKLMHFVSRADLAGIETLKEQHQDELDIRDGQITDLETRLEELIESEAGLRAEVSEADRRTRELSQLNEALDQKHRNCELQLGKAKTETAGLKQQVANLTEILKTKPEPKPKPKPRAGKGAKNT